MRKRLKKERNNRLWTQAYTAQKLGITERAYRHFEAGTHAPSYDTLIKLETLFGMSHKELLVQDCTPTTKAE